MNNKLIYFSTIAAVAGFLFGFDTVVISGANLPLRDLWNTSDWFHSTFIMSMALWGTVIGAIFGGIPSDRFGRRSTLFWIGVLYLISAIGSALSTDPYMFSLFRFVGGLGVGASSVAVPTYISEIAGAKQRGRLVAMYQFMIVFGILIAYVSNYLLQGFGGTNDWRWMMGVEAIPAALYVVFIMTIPESPRWLILKKGNVAHAMIVLKEFHGDQIAASELEAIRSGKPQGTKENLIKSKYSTPILLAFLIAAFNQLSGINFILYYAPEILEKAGFGASGSLLSSILVGCANLIFTMLGMYLIDRSGRKKLMYFGSAGYIISLTMVAISFYLGLTASFKLVFILIFIASHALGQGAVIWVFISEIFPNKVRALGQSFGSATHWIFAAFITMVGSVVINSFSPWVVFAFFAGFMILQLMFVMFMMPETKGISLEDLQKKMIETKVEKIEEKDFETVAA